MSITRNKPRLLACLLAVSLFAAPPSLLAQSDTAPGSRNVMVAGQWQGAAGLSYGAVMLEQQRPFAYVARTGGFDVIGLSDPARPVLLHSQDDGQETGGFTAFHRDGRTWLVRGTPAGATFYDVTGLPEAEAMAEGVTLQAASGYHALFAYRHPDGRALLFATGGGDIDVYDLGQVLASARMDAKVPGGKVASLSTPQQIDDRKPGFEDVTVAYHPETEQDRLYAAGAGGYYVFDISDLNAPNLIASVSSAAVVRGHRLAPSPDGQFLVTGADYRTAPMRIFDLQPALDGTIRRVRTGVGAWTANWKNRAHNFEMRWPYVFVASLEDGFQVFNMRDPVNPYTYAHYAMWTGATPRLADAAVQGAWDVDVRNSDGLIAVTDRTSGLWLLRLDDFRGWDGRGWGLPNISSVQDWEDGPLSALAW